jgi:hypothetical protein
MVVGFTTTYVINAYPEVVRSNLCEDEEYNIMGYCLEAETR